MCLKCHWEYIWPKQEDWKIKECQNSACLRISWQEANHDSPCLVLAVSFAILKNAKTSSLTTPSVTDAFATNVLQLKLKYCTQ